MQTTSIHVLNICYLVRTRFSGHIPDTACFLLVVDCILLFWLFFSMFEMLYAVIKKKIIINTDMQLDLPILYVDCKKNGPRKSNRSHIHGKTNFHRFLPAMNVLLPLDHLQTSQFRISPAWRLRVIMRFHWSNRLATITCICVPPHYLTPCFTGLYCLSCKQSFFRRVKNSTLRKGEWRGLSFCCVRLSSFKCLSAHVAT